MYTILISPKLASLLKGGLNKTAIDKEAAKWENLSYEDQVAYLKRHPKSKRKITAKPGEAQKIVLEKKREYDSMSIPEIQDSLRVYKKDMSPREFKKLYQNFLPLMLSTVKKVIGSRHPSKDDVEDLKQQASIIFVKALTNADPENKGIIKYFQDTLYRQLLGKAREIFRSSVSIPPKDRRAQRAVQKYIHEYYNKHQQVPTDYDQMAREINAVDNKVDNLTPDLITDLIQSGTVSMEEQVGGDDDKRQVQEVLGPTGVKGEENLGFFETPEEDAIRTQFKDVVRKSIDNIEDEQERYVIKLFYGLDDNNPEVEGSVTNIANLMGMQRRDVKKLLQNAERRLRGMKDIQNLRESSSKIFKIMANINKHIKFAYKPEMIKKIGSSYVVDGFVVKRFGKNQFICSCGNKNCFHKDAAITRMINA